MNEQEKIRAQFDALRKMAKDDPPDSLIADIMRPDRELRSHYADRLNKGEFRVVGKRNEINPHVPTRDEEYDAKVDEEITRD